MHLGDERADGVDDLEPALRALLVDLRRDAVRREDDQLALGNLVLGLDEDRAAGLEVADDMDVVDDLVAHVDRRPMLLEQLLDDVDRAHDSGAEASRRGDENALAHRELLRRARQRGGRLASVARGADRPDRLCHERSRDDLPVRAAVRPCPAQTSRPTGWSPESEIARTTPASRPVDASTPLSMSTTAAPALLGKRTAGLGLVGDAVGGDRRPRARRRRPRGRARPRACARTGPTTFVAVDERARPKRVAETAREAERDELPFGQRKAGAETDERRARARLPGRLLLHLQGAGQSYRRVHARLRTVSLTLEVVAIVADGSKPEWMPQCSQRWSFPGP